MGHIEEFLKDLQAGPNERVIVEHATATRFELKIDALIARELVSGGDSDEIALTLSRKAEKLLLLKSTSK